MGRKLFTSRKSFYLDILGWIEKKKIFYDAYLCALWHFCQRPSLHKDLRLIKSDVIRGKSYDGGKAKLPTLLFAYFLGWIYALYCDKFFFLYVVVHEVKITSQFD